jgi:hypothetical protein
MFGCAFAATRRPEVTIDIREGEQVDAGGPLAPVKAVVAGARTLTPPLGMT